MREALVHRGPDGDGFWSDGHAALGFRRLAIIDLEGGAQPMAGEDDTVHLVLNGEIYNHASLRRELEGRHTFRSRCDAEAVVHAYEEWGERCVDHLDGMFAFAVWDSKTRTLFAARDRLGKKPLVYAERPGGLAFASEIRALVAAGLGGTVDDSQLEPYLAFGYVPSPASMIRGVRKLPPAHWLRYRKGRLEIRRYWEPTIRADGGMSEAAHAGRVREVLAAAVTKRLMADVPVGAFLSGGIDSSIVTGLMSRAGRATTVTVGFEDPALDERAAARVVAERFASDHHETVVGLDAAALLPEVILRFGEPFGDPSAIPTYVLAREMRRRAKVALSGDGGDECFAGYERHLFLKHVRTLGRIPGLARLMKPVFGRRVRGALDRVGRSAAEIYRHVVSVFDDERRLQLLRSPGGLAAGWIEAPFGRGGDAVSSAGAADLMTYLPEDLLVKVDIASMASGLEVRCPFLDPSVVEAAFAVPGAMKVGAIRTKAFLRRAFRDLLPAKIARRSKRGFSIPVSAWLRGPLREMVRDLLLDATARGRGWFDIAVVESLLREHERGRDRGSQIWLLLVLEIWVRDGLRTGKVFQNSDRSP